MRDHTKLEAFKAVDELAVAVHQLTRDFPSFERFGLALQLRRASVSAAANIVEGCARETSAELARFFSIVYGSVRETEYELDLALRLGYIKGDAAAIREQAALASRLVDRLAKHARTFRSEDARRSRS